MCCHEKKICLENESLFKIKTRVQCFPCCCPALHLSNACNEVPPPYYVNQKSSKISRLYFKRKTITCYFLNKSLLQKFCQFWSHAKNLSVTVDFSQGIESKQQMHFWIGLELPQGGKLLPCQTNSQILRYLHFCDTFFQLFPLTQLS